MASVSGTSVPDAAPEALPGTPKHERIGLVLDQVKNGIIKIKGFVAGGSANECGMLKEGDELVRVDGRAVADLTLAQATDLIVHGYQEHQAKGAVSIKPTGQLMPPEGKRSSVSGKPCGIGLTILDNPPHVVTYITPNGPAACSHAIQIGDILVAINNELVADMGMDEIVPRVIGEEGSAAELWLERVPPGVTSHNHHEFGGEIRMELSKLETLLQDGVLDHTTYSTACEKLWKGCYSVRLIRGVAYSGEISVDSLAKEAERGSVLSDSVELEFFRPSAKMQVVVKLPRPPPPPQLDPRPMPTSVEGPLVSPSTPFKAASAVAASIAAAICDGVGTPVKMAKSDSKQLERTSKPEDGKPVDKKGESIAQDGAPVTENEKPCMRDPVEAESEKPLTPPEKAVVREEIEDSAQVPRNSNDEGSCGEAGGKLGGGGVGMGEAVGIGREEEYANVVAFVGAGDKIGLGLAKAKNSNSVLVSGLAPGGTAAQAAAIKVGHELVSVDGVCIGTSDIPAICSQIANGPDLHVTLSFIPSVSKLKSAFDKIPNPRDARVSVSLPKDEISGQDLERIPDVGLYRVVLPRPNHWDKLGLSCACPVCKPMRDLVQIRGSSRRSSRKSFEDGEMLRNSVHGEADPASNPAVPGCADLRDLPDDSDVEDIDSTEIDQRPWWEKVGDNGKKDEGVELGSMLMGGLLKMFSQPRLSKRASPEDLERERQEQLRKAEKEFEKQVSLWEAAEKLPQLLASKTVVSGILFVSDDTDEILTLPKFRAILDPQDEEDLAWLLSQDTD